MRRQMVIEFMLMQGNFAHQMMEVLKIHTLELMITDEVDPVERAILRIGSFELEFQLEIPYKAVINEAVELAKTFGAEHGHKYVNAILDKVAFKLRVAETTARRHENS